MEIRLQAGRNLMTGVGIKSRGLHGLSLATPEVDEPEAGRLSDTRVAR
jgi:hypothetical protein